MRVAHYSASLVPQSAARRLQLALSQEGVDAYSVVQSSASGDIKQIIQGTWEKLARRAGRKLERIFLNKFYGLPYDAPWNLSSFGIPADKSEFFEKPDILHLHWIAGGALALSSIERLNIPVIWTMHDTWAFTGGCHYTNTGCERYVARCGQCPELCSKRRWDISRLHWLAKHRAVQKIQPVIISPSVEYARKAAKSGMLRDCRIEVIPNTLDTHI
jgi:hypothetical protein